MEKQSNTNKRRLSGTTEVKLLIVTLSMTISIGLWTLFSKQPLPSASNPPADNAPAPSEPSADTVISLSPIPTLVPSSLAISGSFPQPAQQVTNLPAQPVMQAPAKIFLGGSKPQPRSVAPAPVTRTRSSR